MSLDLVRSKILKNESEIWLHRYFSSKYLDNVIENNSLNIRFSAFDTFSDGLEGWDYRIKNIKKAINEMALFNNRVIKDNGVIEAIDCLELILIENHSEGHFDKKLVKENILERKRHYVSCWFSSNTNSSESRIMWDIYAKKRNEIGLKVSIKWLDLKEALIKSDVNFRAGLVNYVSDENPADSDYMFLKDISYEHERELRIIIKKDSPKNKYEEMKFDINIFKNLFVTVENSHNNQDVINRLEKLGFSKSHGFSKTYNVSKLLPEFLKYKEN